MKYKYKRYTIAKLYNGKYCLAIQHTDNIDKCESGFYGDKHSNLIDWECHFDTIDDARKFYFDLKNGIIKDTFVVVENGEWEQSN